MKIFVCVKQVPDTSGKVAVKPDGTMDRASMAAITNPDDLNAVEAALTLKDAAPGSTVIVISMGPPPAAGMLKELLAMGCDEAVLVSAREFGGSDTFATSQILAAAIRHIGLEKEDLILCGRQAIDGDTAQVGPQIAEKLGIPQVSYAAGIRKEGDTLTVKRVLEDGYAKRTVEGDLGIRYNAATILDMVGPGRILANMAPGTAMAEETLRSYVYGLRGRVEHVPADGQEAQIDVGLASSAVSVAVERHAGTIRSAWGLSGEIQIQEGKDLTRLRTVIGTGGVFAHNPWPGKILSASLYSDETPFSLKPMRPRFYVDRSYLLYGVGLLSDVEPRAALRIAKKYLEVAED